jgi:hypothetical protein
MLTGAGAAGPVALAASWWTASVKEGRRKAPTDPSKDPKSQAVVNAYRSAARCKKSMLGGVCCGGGHGRSRRRGRTRAANGGRQERAAVRRRRRVQARGQPFSRTRANALEPRGRMFVPKNVPSRGTNGVWLCLCLCIFLKRADGMRCHARL